MVRLTFFDRRGEFEIYEREGKREDEGDLVAFMAVGEGKKDSDTENEREAVFVELLLGLTDTVPIKLEDFLVEEELVTVADKIMEGVESIERVKGWVEEEVAEGEAGVDAEKESMGEEDRESKEDGDCSCEVREEGDVVWGPEGEMKVAVRYEEVERTGDEESEGECEELAELKGDRVIERTGVKLCENDLSEVGVNGTEFEAELEGHVDVEASNVSLEEGEGEELKVAQKLAVAVFVVVGD